MLNDPNESAENQRRLVLFIAISLMVLLGFQQLMPQRPVSEEDEVAEETTDGDEREDGDDDNDVDDEGDQVAGGDEAPDTEPTPAVDVPDALPPQRLVSDNGALLFTNTGARLTGVEIHTPEQYIPHANMEGVFPDAEDADDPYLDYALTIDGLSDLQADSRYAFVADESEGNDTDGYSRLVYRWLSPDGAIAVTRTYAPDERDFGVVMTVDIENRSSRERRFDGVELAMFGRSPEGRGGLFGGQMASQVETICVQESDATHKQARRLKERRGFDGGINFGAIEERYFMVAAAPRDADGAPLTADRCDFEPLEDEYVVTRIGFDELELGAGETTTYHYTLYVGPKDERFLKAFDHEFHRSINFGFFTILSVPIRIGLLFWQSLLINWGLAIIALTLTIKLITLPLTQKSFQNMEKMREIQPKLQEIQKKYENDRMKLAEEQMKLFREAGTSPLGGCLPMFLQMPIYFALYRTIWGSVELYRAPFYGWLADLSQPDPYFILPVLMGVVMFAQQKLMPASGNNAQMKMMQTMMPIVFTVMMLMMPSGLVLYIFVNMLLSVAQQLYIRRSRATAAA